MSTTQQHKPKAGVSLNFWRDYQGLYQASVENINENGYGGGYRLAGPSFIGRSSLLYSVLLDERSARELMTYCQVVLDEAET